MIVGVDEVGRGSWAGPLVVGAVALGGAEIAGLTDSKKIPKKRREKLSEQIIEACSGYGLGWVDAEEIDKIGLSAALTLATIRSLNQIKVPYSEIIIDGTVNFIKDSKLGRYVTTIKKADLLIPSVSAASVIAKVARDSYMEDQDEEYPGYNFTSHVGYGTSAHRSAIDSLGVTPLHRLSFASLAKHSSIGMNVSAVKKAPELSTKSIGDRAEVIATEYLVANGHTILERNWRTKFCEIDIVSRYDSTIYFTEVKYRKDSQQGGGLAAITPKKLNKMKFAAEVFAFKNLPPGTNLRLSVIDMVGDEPSLASILDID